jgi:serine/threonine protein kinase
VRRFLREGYAANAVNHPAVAAVHDDGLDEHGSHFLVMDLVEGTSLEDHRMAWGGALPVEEVVQIGEQLLDALAAAHERGIVHRDIKPGNLLWSGGARLTVLDFGIAHLRRAAWGPSDTLQGGLLGTPAYMPPEQARGRWDEVDAVSDVWSAGATLFTLISGRLPHEGGTPNELMASAMAREPPRLEAVAPAIPQAVTAVIDKALCYRKSDRWQSARQMQAALRQAAEALGISLQGPASDFSSDSAISAAEHLANDAPALTAGNCTSRHNPRLTRSCVESLSLPPLARRKPTNAVKTRSAIAGVAILLALASQSLSSPQEELASNAPGHLPRPHLVQPAAGRSSHRASEPAQSPSVLAAPEKPATGTQFTPAELGPSIAAVSPRPTPRTSTAARVSSRAAKNMARGIRRPAPAPQPATLSEAWQLETSADERLAVPRSLRALLPDPLDRRR